MEVIVAILSLIVIAILIYFIVCSVKGDLIFMHEQNSRISEANFSINFDDSIITNYTILEHSYCINGKIILNRTSSEITYSLEKIRKEYVGQKKFVDGECDYGDLAHLHTHPSGACYASNSDIKFWQTQAEKGIVLFIIQCEENKFVFYTQENLYRGYIYEK